MTTKKKEHIKPINELKSCEELFNRIESSYSLIFVDTPEETRLIRNIYKKYKGNSVQYWSLTQGLLEISNDTDPSIFELYDFPPSQARLTSGNQSSIMNIMNTFKIIEEDCRARIESTDALRKKTIYVLRDADKFFTQPGPIRALRDIIYLVSSVGCNIIITGFGLSVPSDFEKDAAFIKYSYPTTDEIREILIPNYLERINAYNKKVTEDKQINTNIDPVELAVSCTGLTEDQIISSISYSASKEKKICTNIILEEKRSIINKNDLLEYWVGQDNLETVGGFKELKNWFEEKKIVMQSIFAKEFKAEDPKGIMILGLQGSGKSFICQALAQSWGVGLIKMDMSKMFGSLVGQSESNMRKALMQVEAAGGIVMVDEIDKGLSGAGSSDRTDGGTTARVIGTLLQWLQQPHPGVFLVATANDISNLNRNHPELLRKGRFDEIWFSDAPTFEERKEIFKIHLQKRLRDPEKFDLTKLAEYEYKDPADNKKYPITGAEIEYAVKDAIQKAFAKGNGKKLEINSKDDIQTDDILDKLKIIKPISFISKDTISVMRKWSAINARNVSCIEIVKESKHKGNKNLQLRGSKDIEI